MKKETIIPVKFNKELTIDEIASFVNICISFGKEIQADVSHISMSAVAKRIEFGYIDPEADQEIKELVDDFIENKEQIMKDPEIIKFKETLDNVIRENEEPDHVKIVEIEIKSELLIDLFCKHIKIDGLKAGFSIEAVEIGHGIELDWTFTSYWEDGNFYHDEMDGSAAWLNGEDVEFKPSYYDKLISAIKDFGYRNNPYLRP